MMLTIEIAIGNEATLHADDIAALLTKTAGRIASGQTSSLMGESDGKIMDTNGATVGTWRVEA